MSDYRVASRYARSLFDLAIELKKINKVHDDMKLLQQVFEENLPLIITLRNPIIRFDYKLKVLQRVFEKHVSDVTLAFFRLVCRKNRAHILPDCTKVFITLYNDYMGIIQSGVTTAAPLSATAKKDFESVIAKATGKKVELASKTDPSLIGGYILRIGDRQLDDSIRTKLNELRRELKGRH